jgi:hypothetical protein
MHVLNDIIGRRCLDRIVGSGEDCTFCAGCQKTAAPRKGNIYKVQMIAACRIRLILTPERGILSMRQSFMNSCSVFISGKSRLPARPRNAQRKHSKTRIVRVHAYAALPSKRQSATKACHPGRGLVRPDSKTRLPGYAVLNLIAVASIAPSPDPMRNSIYSSVLSCATR